MKLISCISWWLDRPDLEIRSVDDVTNVRDEEAGFLFSAVIVGRFSGETLKGRVELGLFYRCRQMALMRRKSSSLMLLLHEGILWPEVISSRLRKDR